ncbi:DUF2147 domain-containing protein [Pedobacter sp. L105]|uniref:DUF2147 domain-containing protein n=1 Tax=Pedobacter sp. L105 TaxID=1641871 RepID=UPI00131D753A|nr:DUF2147 domain-containing protein [Pedobacter sp. L105]
MKKSVKFLSCLALCICLFTCAFSSFNPDAILGSWKNEPGDRSMEIYKKENRYYGEITSSKDEHKIKTGTMILRDFVATKYGYTGKFYIPSTDKEEDAELLIQDKDTINIKVTIGFVSQSRKWIRIGKP